MRIKVTEEQYALLNEYINGAKNIQEQEEGYDTFESISTKVKNMFKKTEDIGSNSNVLVLTDDGNEFILIINNRDGNNERVLQLSTWGAGRQKDLIGNIRKTLDQQRTYTESGAISEISNVLNIKPEENNEMGLFPNVTIDLKIVDKIKKLVEYFPGDLRNFGGGINGLYDKLQYLENPGYIANQSMQEGMNALVVLNYLKKLRDDDLFEPSSSGFFFESFIAGLLGAERQDEKGKAKGAADITGKDGKTYSLKLYSDNPNQRIQIKSKTQKVKDITDYVLVGVKKSSDLVEIHALKTKNLNPSKNNYVYNSGGKWSVTQDTVINKGQSFSLDYRSAKKQIEEVSGDLIKRVKKMDDEMQKLKSSIDDMIKPDNTIGEIESAAEEAKVHGKELDKAQGEIEKSEELLKSKTGAEKEAQKVA